MSQRTERVLLAIRELITQPSERDLQLKVGPSDLGDPCNYCLGRKMAGIKAERDFSMYPWLGTAIHKLIQYLVEPLRFFYQPNINDMAWELFGLGRARTEIKVFICHIPGYGDVYGNIDVLLELERIIIDWKSSSRKKIKLYKLHGVPTENLGQTILYIHGARKSGYDVEAAVLVYIPRDAADLGELWAYEVEYDESEVNQIIERATIIQQWVTAGRWQELDKDPDCWTCNPRPIFN